MLHYNKEQGFVLVREVPNMEWIKSNLEIFR